MVASLMYGHGLGSVGEGDDFRISTVPPNSDMNMTVRDLIHVNTMRWNEEVIRGCFTQEDASIILQVPLLVNDEQDNRIWAYSNSSLYTVKSAYRVFCDKLANEDHLKVNDEWLSMWKMDLPPKIKAFTLRFCRDVLPIRANLQRRGVHCPLSCVVSDREVENSWHLFFTCPTSSRCWILLGIWNTIVPLLTSCDSIIHLIFWLLHIDCTDQAQLILGTTWSIWKTRNEKLWDGKEVTMESILNRVCVALHEWK